MSSQEVRAAAETYSELGPEYRDAVVESFLDKIGQVIDARVDARVAQQPAQMQAVQPSQQRRRMPYGSPMALAVTSMILGIPISAIAVAAGKHPAGALGLFVVWVAIAVINVAYCAAYRARSRPPADRH